VALASRWRDLGGILLARLRLLGLGLWRFAVPVAVVTALRRKNPIHQHLLFPPLGRDPHRKANRLQRVAREQIEDLLQNPALLAARHHVHHLVEPHPAGDTQIQRLADFQQFRPSERPKRLAFERHVSPGPPNRWEAAA
jgi:hypothetical protein